MDDPLDLERDAAMVEFTENSLNEIALDNVRGYLGTYGDAVEERVRQCVVEAKKLLESNFWGPWYNPPPQGGVCEPGAGPNSTEKADCGSDGEA